jgi:hypothetical protein
VLLELRPIFALRLLRLAGVFTPRRFTIHGFPATGRHFVWRRSAACGSPLRSAGIGE